jgi:two-component system CheB/CheR fusion protein
MTDLKKATDETTPPANEPEAGHAFENLLAYLKQSRGFDFTGYKRNSLMRRVKVRMQTVGRSRFSEYQDYLQVDPDEFTHLFNTILINVTTFFRDPEAWKQLAEQVLPELVGPEGSTHSIRAWSAGCASGEEAYTLAILLAEALGVEQFRARVKIYATDVDEEALNHARQSQYQAQALENVPPQLLEKYFEPAHAGYIVRKDLRRSVIFGRHDLIQDAPISKINILTCRNCLMYFNSEAQAQILVRFHFSLVKGGVLLLGKAETLLTRAGPFKALDIKQRLFSKSPDPSSGDRTSLFEPVRGGPMNTNSRLVEAAAEGAPVAQLIVDQQGSVLTFNHQLRSLFALSSRDVGRPLQDLELSYRPFELRSALEQAYREGRPVTFGEAPWTTPEAQPVRLALLVVPVADSSGGFLGAVFHFTDVTQQRRLQDEVQRASQELETALEELQSTNEELETTNEELQSTVEELETTNEELQSTNEELETMNEELQSTNEELQTINAESRERNDMVSELNAFLEGILTSLRGAVVVVDRDLRVHKWNHRAEDMWGLRSDEVLGRNFLNLDSGLPVEQLKTPIRTCLAQEQESTETRFEATNRRGKPISVRVTCTPLVERAGDPPRGVILLMDGEDGKL